MLPPSDGSESENMSDRQTDSQIDGQTNCSITLNSLP